MTAVEVQILMVIVVVLLIILMRYLFMRRSGAYKTYIIEQGDHYSWRLDDPLEFRFKVAPTFKRLLKFEARFLKAMYNVDFIGDSVNKLFGLQFSWTNQLGSARIGWRPTADSRYHELFAYIHDGHKRVIIPLCKIDYWQQVCCFISVNKRDRTLGFQVVPSGDAVDDTTYIGFSRDSYVDYKLESNVMILPIMFKQFPYFGGDKTAPDKCKFLIREF